MSLHLPTQLKKPPCVRKVVPNDFSLFYGVKSIEDDIVLENFHTVLNKLREVPQSTVFWLFQKENSYRYIYPHTLVSKQYVHNFFL